MGERDKGIHVRTELYEICSRRFASLCAFILCCVEMSLFENFGFVLIDMKNWGQLVTEGFGSLSLSPSLYKYTYIYMTAIEAQILPITTFAPTLFLI